MVQVAPSILSADFANLAQSCAAVVTKDNPMLHIDVMDGVFVPNISFGAPVLKSLVKALPEAVYDVHLMIGKPALYIETFAKAGADAITIHYECESPLRQTLCKIRALGCKAGISLRPATDVSEVFGLLDILDIVLVMSVEPGFGGQSFQPQALDKISALHAEAQRQNTALHISVDGGIDLQTAPACVKAGASILVAGSAVFGALNPAGMVQQLRRAGEQ